jgi:hypothetical protein
LQYKAFILILCTVCYLAEWVATPRMMAVACRPVAEAHAAPTCCHGAGQAEKKECPKPGKGCNPAADCCLNCPMCFVMVVPALVTGVEEQGVSTEYPVLSSSYAYSYYASCWKPPNAA